MDFKHKWIGLNSGIIFINAKCLLSYYRERLVNDSMYGASDLMRFEGSSFTRITMFTDFF